MLTSTLRSSLPWVLVVGAACGADPEHAADATHVATTVGDAAPTTDTIADDTRTSPDGLSPDGLSPDGVAIDGLATGDGGPATDVTTVDAPASDADAPGEYIVGCGSLFAARVVEKQVALAPEFPRNCDAALVDAVGRLRPGGEAMCRAGESADACRARLYATPPDLDDLAQGCWSASPPEGCMRGSWVPRCADGTDACAQDEAVCADGTRPMVYAEAATVGPSDAWIFHLGGEGGPCSGGLCWANYRYGEPAFARSMTTLHPDDPASAASRPGGIMSADPALPYARLNRVRFERCTDAATDAIEQVPIADGVPAELAARYPDLPVESARSTAPVWHRGFDTWRATFRHLTTVAGRDRDADGTPEMPSLADARLVILSGSSDASMWVTFAADRLAAELRAIAGADVDVRMMVDGMFPPMLDNEARYHPDVPAGFDMLSMPYHETGLCRLDDNGDGADNEACSGATYSQGGAVRASHDARGVLLDASCLALHGSDADACYDRNHVLVHHVGVPVFVLADQEDNTVSDGAPAYAHDRSYTWSLPHFRRRILDQGWDLVDRWATDAREEGAGAPGGLVLVLPKTRRAGEPAARATHVRFGNDDALAREMTLCSAAGTKVVTASYNQMISAWLTGDVPRTFAIEDARRALPDGSFWVTGGACRAPE